MHEFNGQSGTSVDPDETLRQIRAIIAHIDEATGSSGLEDVLAEKIRSLDDWLSRGGFLPAAWEPRPK